jgi:hypothetical protein
LASSAERRALRTYRARPKPTPGRASPREYRPECRPPFPDAGFRASRSDRPSSASLRVPGSIPSPNWLSLCRRRTIFWLVWSRNGNRVALADHGPDQRQHRAFRPGQRLRSRHLFHRRVSGAGGATSESRLLTGLPIADCELAPLRGRTGSGDQFPSRPVGRRLFQTTRSCRGRIGAVVRDFIVEVREHVAAGRRGAVANDRRAADLDHSTCARGQ